MKPKYLWHGSTVKYEILKLSQARDVSGHPAGNKKAVYATDRKLNAIQFGMVDKKYKKFGDFRTKPMIMVIISGWIRTGKKLYLHKLSSRGFKEQPKGSHQWVKEKEAKPLEIIELNVNDYKHLCRKANKKDIEYFKSCLGMFSKDGKMIRKPIEYKFQFNSNL